MELSELYATPKTWYETAVRSWLCNVGDQGHSAMIANTPLGSLSIKVTNAFANHLGTPRPGSRGP
jgi:hypothetical protein